MTGLQAIERVEQNLTELRLKDRFGDPIDGIEAAGILARFHGPVWDEVMRQFETGAIDADFYADSMIALIKEYAGFLHRCEIEKIIRDIQESA